MSQTTLRSILGQSQLDDLLAKREEINAELQKVIDQQTEPWGVKVTAVEVKNVDLPVEMQRAIAKQAEAERERRAKIIHAEGRISGVPEACRCSEDYSDRKWSAAAQISPDTCRDSHREELNNNIPCADRFDKTISREKGES